MKIKEQLEMIDEETYSINFTAMRIYYILKHIVYDRPKPKERIFWEKFLLELIQDIKTNAEGVDNVLRGIFKN